MNKFISRLAGFPMIYENPLLIFTTTSSIISNYHVKHLIEKLEKEIVPARQGVIELNSDFKYIGGLYSSGIGIPPDVSTNYEESIRMAQSDPGKIGFVCKSRQNKDVKEIKIIKSKK